jgi:hypothetical protein
MDDDYAKQKAKWRTERYHLEQKIANLRRELRRVQHELDNTKRKGRKKPPRGIDAMFSQVKYGTK